MENGRIVKRNILPISFAILLPVVICTLLWNHFQGTSYGEFHQLSTNSDIIVTRYYKGVPEKVTYSLSADAIQELNSTLKQSRFRSTAKEEFQLTNDYSFYFKVRGAEKELLDFSVSDNYVSINHSGFLQCTDSLFYEKISSIVNSQIEV